MKVKFVPWAGGKCPVPAWHDISVKFRDSEVIHNSGIEGWYWKWGALPDNFYDIVGYFDYTINDTYAPSKNTLDDQELAREVKAAIRECW